MRKLKGVIISDTMQKTAVVRVDRLMRHPKYRKYYRVSRAFKADTGGGAYRMGDEVMIQETRPISKEKRWKIIGIVKKTKEVEFVEESQEGKTENEK